MLLITGSTNKENRPWWYLSAFDARTGAPRWQSNHPGVRPGINLIKGQQDRHPVINGNTVYALPFAYNLQTGVAVNPLEKEGEWRWADQGGCGTISGSAHALFFRSLNPTMYQLGAGAEGKRKKLDHVNRSGCWMSIISAGGLVLAPKSSSGCTCDYPLQTSLAFVPTGEPSGE